MSRNIEELIGGARGRSMRVEKEIDETGQIARSRTLNEDGVKSREFEARIGKGRGMSMNDEEGSRRSKSVSRKVEERCGSAIKKLEYYRRIKLWMRRSLNVREGRRR
jgi:hypothetical protein